MFVVVNSEENWRKKLQTIVPATGIKVPHIRTGEPVVLPRRVLAVFLLMTIADFGDQYYGYQDALYDNIDGRLEFTGNTNFDVLWPGNGKPGLWMNLISKMGAIYTLLVREEEIFKEERKRGMQTLATTGNSAYSLFCSSFGFISTHFFRM